MENTYTTFEDITSLSTFQITRRHSLYNTWEAEKLYNKINTYQLATFFVGLIPISSIWFYAYNFTQSGDIIAIWIVFLCMIILWFYLMFSVSAFRMVEFYMDKVSAIRDYIGYSEIEEIQKIATLLRRAAYSIFSCRNTVFLNAIDKFFLHGEIRKYLEESEALIHSIQEGIAHNILVYIEQNKQTLVLAKSDIEVDISWNTQLAKVVDLQKLRLDNQIKQFEELQKLLVKI